MADFLEPSEVEQAARIKIEAIARPLLLQKKRYSCPETTFTTDAPGGSFWTRFKDPIAITIDFYVKLFLIK